jgi:hypothetical protein
MKGRKDHQQERKENITRTRSSAQERKEKNVHGCVSVIEHHLLTLTRLRLPLVKLYKKKFFCKKKCSFV